MIRSLQSIPQSAPKPTALSTVAGSFIRNYPLVSNLLEATEFFKKLRILRELGKLDHMALRILHQIVVEALRSRILRSYYSRLWFSAQAQDKTVRHCNLNLCK